MRRMPSGRGMPFVPLMQRGDQRSKGQSKGEWVVYRDAAPYPEVSGPADADTVDMLRRDYAGSAGELSGITQYVYQSIAAGAGGEEAFANALLQIAIVEMMHLDMLGDAIAALGGDPRFCDDRQRYWSAADIDYSLGLEDMVRADIEAEETGIDNYQKHAAQTDNKSVRELLLRIAEDEKLHLHFFRRMLKPRAPMDDRYERT